MTASQLVERLEERGLVQRVGEQAGGRGPNAQLYSVAPGERVRGRGRGRARTGVIAACADITGEIIGRVEQSTQDTDDPVGVVHNAVVEAASRPAPELSSVRRIVLGTPGLVDPATGDIVFAWNLPRWHRGLLAALRDDLQHHDPVRERREPGRRRRGAAGAARDVDDFLLVWVGGGIGLAVVLGGRLHRGCTGAAGEIGYLPVPGAARSRAT